MLHGVGQLVIAPPVEAALAGHAQEVYPEECCGVLVGPSSSEAPEPDCQVTALWPVDNREVGDRRRGYTLSPEDLLEVYRRARREGREVIGYYHSHPDGEAVPSRRDLAEAVTGVRYLIVEVTQSGVGEMRCWRLRSDQSGFDEELLIRGA